MAVAPAADTEAAAEEQAVADTEAVAGAISGVSRGALFLEWCASARDITYLTFPPTILFPRGVGGRHMI